MNKNFTHNEQHAVDYCFVSIMGHYYLDSIISHCCCNVHTKSAFRDRRPVCM